MFLDKLICKKAVLLLTIICAFGILYSFANNGSSKKYFTMEETAAYVIYLSNPEYSREVYYSWINKNIPVERINPNIKPSLIKLIKPSYLRSPNRKEKLLARGALQMFGFIAEKQDIVVLEKYMQDGLDIMKNKDIHHFGGQGPYAFVFLGRAVGAMIARDIPGAKEFFLKYCDRKFWDKHGISAIGQSYIISKFAGQVYIMSKYGKARDLLLEPFNIDGKLVTQMPKRVVKNLEKKYTPSQYVMLTSPRNYLSSSNIQTITKKMKQLFPEWFHFFKIQQPIIQKQNTSSLSIPAMPAKTQKLQFPDFQSLQLSSDKTLSYKLEGNEDLKKIESEAIKAYHTISVIFKNNDYLDIFNNIADDGIPLALRYYRNRNEQIKDFKQKMQLGIDYSMNIIDEINRKNFALGNARRRGLPCQENHFVKGKLKFSYRFLVFKLDRNLNG